MGRRRSIRRVASDVVQGEGSWVDVREIKYGDYKNYRQMTTEAQTLEDPVAREQAGADLDGRVILDNVVAWNWVNDNDDPLSLPIEQPSVIDALTVKEKGFLITAIFEVEQAKN